MATVIHFKKGKVNIGQGRKVETESLSQGLEGYGDAMLQQRKMLEGLITKHDTVPLKEGFDAKKFTGKIKSFGEAMDFQKNIRNEW